MELTRPSKFTDGGAQFLCDRAGTDDPVLAVRKAVGEVFADVRSRIPVDLDALLAKRRIDLVIGQVPPGKEALLKPVPQGFRLTVSPPPLELQRSLFQDPARRFIVAHEIIETFFFSYESDIPTHWTTLGGYRALATPEALSAGGSEERLCDYGAGLILVPSHKVGEVTDNGMRIPGESSLMRAATQCSTSTLNMCHRIASYLWIRHSNHAVVAIVKKCSDPNSKVRDIAWRFAPTKKGAGFPVGADIEATLKHKFFLSTNKTLRGLGFTALTQWLDCGAKTAEPIGEECEFKQNGDTVRLRVRCVSYDDRRSAAVVWFDLSFSS